MMVAAEFIWWMAVGALVAAFADTVFRMLRPQRWVVRATRQRIVLGMLEVGTLLLWFVAARGRWPFLDERDAWVMLAGAMLALTGALFAAWAKFRLGRLFSPQLGVQEEHRLITTGPYAVVRHPIYLGLIDFIAGAALFLNDAGLLLVAMLFTLYFTAQLRIEERYFAEHFGAEWERYRARTPALFPWKRRPPTDGTDDR
jgi:protein-S-isoprenylcysteine O-methyltransferase Ste14